MDYKKMYEEWLSNPYFDAETKKELERYLFERQRLMLQRERGGESVRLK